MEAVLKRVIVGDNPWLERPEVWKESVRVHLPDLFIPRRSESELVREGLAPSKAALVTGPRQAGKSSLLWHLALEQGLRLLLVNCEEPAVLELARSPAVFLHEMAGFLEASSALFLEEVQHLGEAGLFIKGLVDRKPRVPILVTGSSSYELRSRTRESLAGRASRFRVLPLSLDEVGYAWCDLPVPVREMKREEAWQRQVVHGGYPEVWTSDGKEVLLSHLVDSYLMRDASDLYRIGRPDAFRVVMRLVASQIGSLVNISEYASICGISTETVSSYVGILEESQTVKLVRPFIGGRRAELKARPKAYFIDCGLRNAVLGSFGAWDARSDRGPLLENWVLGELLKNTGPRTEVRYWRSKSGAEVDFVPVTGETITGIEVKATPFRTPRLSRSARSFMDAYRPGRFAVVNLGFQGSEQVGDCLVDWLRPHQLRVFLQACGLT